MAKDTNRIFRRITGWTTTGLGIACLALITTVFLKQEDGHSSLHARLLPAHMRGQSVWKTIGKEEIEKGVTAPADTNIIFHVPDAVDRITMDIFFGNVSTKVRFW